LAAAALLEQAVMVGMGQILFLAHILLQAAAAVQNFILLLILADLVVELEAEDLELLLELLVKERKVVALVAELELRQIVVAVVVAHITWVVMAQEVELLDMAFLHQLLVLLLLMAAAVVVVVM
jgi:hypothetical protein